MTEARAANLTVGELEANYHLYCKALRILVREGKSLVKIQRTVCWDRLETIFHCYPSRYKSPDYLYVLLKREYGDLPNAGSLGATGSAAPST